MTITQTTRPQPRTTRPIDAHAWPAFTEHTPDDVVVAAVALTRLVKWCGTPSVHNSGARDYAGEASATERASVVVTRVIAAEWRSDLRLHVTIDANMGGCRPTVAEARVIGRQATVHLSSASVSWAGAEGAALPAYLPSDLVAGDLIVVPCVGATLLHEVRTA
ncbi:hypothetical protein [Conyzicola sp.]|uniref:hypothetical protein n=1 Tax=Conyzicola sp. TaxID=1969404 RepID=UPI00398975F2